MNPMLFGKYCLLERISVGGMAEVFRAKPFDVPDFRGYLALKRILPHLAEDDEFIKMFVDEARLTVQLDHPNIVRIYELGHFQQSYYILMEFLSGKDLLALQKIMRKRKDVIPAPMALFIAREMARGLHYAHHRRDADGNPLNIIHRDVSPQNVIIDYRGAVKVIDFGIAKAAVQSTRTQVGVLKGKMGYMSPEQVRGEVLDFRSDVFAIGTVLWEMLTNRRLFHTDNEYETMQLVREATANPPSVKNPDITPDVDALVMGAITADPEDRYESAGAFADAIDAWLAQNPFNAEDLSVWMRTVFADTLDEERTKREQFATIRTPDDVRRLIGAPQGGLEEPSAAVEETAEKTEIWDADILPGADEDPMEFAAQHTVVQAGGFDAHMVDLSDGIEPLDAPAPVEPMRAGPPRMATAATFAAQKTDPQMVRPAPPPRYLLIAGVLSGLLAVTGIGSVAAFYALDMGGQASAAAGTLVINVEPSTGIEVLIDGKLVANAGPVTMQNAPVGSHVVEVRRPQHKPFQSTVQIEPGQTQTVQVELESMQKPRGMMVLRFQEPLSDVSVYVDGERQPLGSKDREMSFELPEGRHLFEVRRAGFRPWRLFSDVKGKARTEEVVRFAQQTPSLAIDVDEQSTVYWNGKRLGTGPTEIEAIEPHEVHEVRVTRRGGGNWRSAVGFPELGSGTLNVDFDATLPTSYAKSDFGWLQASTGDAWWEVLIDGVETGFATPLPATRKLPVARGEHTVTFRRGDTKHERKVTIEAGETLILSEPIVYRGPSEG